MAGEVFTLFAKLGIKDEDFQKGINNASKSGKGLSDGLKKAFKGGAIAIGVTAAAVAGVSKAFVGAANKTADYGDKVDKMSQKIGISAEAYQKWDYVMQRAGGNVDSLKMGMKTLSQQAEKNSDSFQKLGISQEEVANLSKEDLFAKTVQGLSKMEDGTERTALATQLLGRAGADMGPLLNQGSKAIQEQMDIAEKYGMVMSDKAVKASADWNDSLTTLSMTTTGLKNRLMGEFLPALKEVTDGLSSLFIGDYDKGIEQISGGVENLTRKLTEMMPKVLEIGGKIVIGIATSIVENLPKVLNSGIQIVVELGKAIISQIPTFLSIGAQIMMSLARSLITALPEVISAINGIVQQIGSMLPEIINGLTEVLPDLLNTIVQGVIDLVTNLINSDMLTQILQSLLTLTVSLAQAIIANIPVIIAALPTLIENIVNFVIGAIPMLISAGIQLFVSLISALPEIITQIVSALPLIIESVISAIIGAIPQLIDAGIQLFISLVKNLPAIIKGIVSAIPKIISSIVTAFGKFFPKIMATGKNLIIKLASGIKNSVKNVAEAAGKIIQKIKDKLKEPIDKAKKWGRDMIQNFIDGIKEKFQPLIDKVKGLASSIAKYLHFSVPDIGPLSDADEWMPDFMDLLASGIDRNKFKVQNAISGLAGDMTIGGDFGGYDYDSVNDTINLELSVADGGNGNIGLQLARLMLPYLQIAEKEKRG